MSAYLTVGHKFKGSVTLTSDTGSASVIQEMSYIVIYNMGSTKHYGGVMQAHMGLSAAEVTIKMDLREQRVTGPLLINRFMTPEYIAIVFVCNGRIVLKAGRRLPCT
ncbi:hypothetical protein QTP88_025832 [Uroleucon formosanum]